jgi:hypothetical protein
VDALSVEAEQAVNDTAPSVDNGDLLPPIGPNGNVVLPMRPASPPWQRREITVTPLSPPAGISETETPFLSRLPPINNTPPSSIADLPPLSPSDHQQIESLKTELENYKRRNVLLDAKLRKEQNKVKRLQPIVSRLEDLDHIAMDGPLENSTRWKKRKNLNKRFHVLDLEARSWVEKISKAR